MSDPNDPNLKTPNTDYANLLGMEPRAAKEYILGYMTTLKTTQMELKRTDEDLALWEGRVRLAAGKNRPDLETAARAKADELREKAGKLRAEEKQLVDDIARMKIQLKAIEHQATFTVDAELLNAQMEQIVGENAGNTEKFRQAEADSALEELKKRLDPNYVPPSPTPPKPESPEQEKQPESSPENPEQSGTEAAPDTSRGE